MEHMATRRRVYVETSVLSYLAAWPSRDLRMAAHQEATHEWWAVARSECECFISDAVTDESRRGDPDAVARREGFAGDLPVLALTAEVGRLAELYRAELALPVDRLADLTHVAFAVVHELDYLVTWNCAHIANELLVRRLVEINARLGRATPFIVTPEEFLAVWTGEQP
jgi:hypothetical protein